MKTPEKKPKKSLPKNKKLQKPLGTGNIKIIEISLSKIFLPVLAFVVLFSLLWLYRGAMSDEKVMIHKDL